MPKQLSHRLPIAAALALAAALAPAAALAEGGLLRLQASLEYTLSDIDSTDENEDSPEFGETTNSLYSWFRQRYNVEAQKELYPYLDFRGGGWFELINSETDTEGATTGFKQRTGRLYAELDLDNPLYTASGAYRRREFKFSPRDFESARIIRDEFSGLWRWRPDGFPSIDLDYNLFHTRDDEDTKDTLNGLLVLKTRYQYEDFLSDYTYTRNDREERIGSGGSLTQVHNAGVRYSKPFLDDRFEATGSARFNYDNLTPTDQGDVQQPTSSPGAAFYLLDDTDPSTLTIVDAANPLTNVNIGRNGPLNPVGMGLDFGPPTEVDTIYVSPLEDASDPTQASPGEIAAVAGGFVWTAFLSDDQLNWTEQIVTSATYNVFENRFEIKFNPTSDAEFVKVVTTPLSTVAKEIRISRIEALTTVPGAPGLEIESFTQTYNLGLRWNATDQTTANYEGFLRIREAEPFGDKKTSLTNSISAHHDFDSIFYADARYLRSDTIESFRADSARNNFTASLAGDYLPTLNQRLIYNGFYDVVGGRRGFGNSILLRTNADVYRDWSVAVDLGYSQKIPIAGPNVTSATFRLLTTIVPNSKFNFSIDYLGAWQTETGRPSGLNQIGRFQAFWIPVRTLSLFAALRIRDQVRDLEGLQLIQTYSVNWAPFPDGAFNFTLAYNQSVDTNNRESRILTPEINWQLTRTTVLRTSFDYGTIEANDVTRDLKVLRIIFKTFY